VLKVMNVCFLNSYRLIL